MASPDVLTQTIAAGQLLAAKQTVAATWAGAIGSTLTAVVAVGVAAWSVLDARTARADAQRRAAAGAAFQVKAAVTALMGMFAWLEAQPAPNQIAEHNVLGPLEFADQCAGTALAVGPVGSELTKAATGLRALVQPLLRVLSGGTWPRRADELFHSMQPFRSGISELQNILEGIETE